MMELIEIRSLPQAAEALNGKPIDWTMVILSRLALRTLPTMAGTDDSWLKFYAVSLFRVNLFAWASLHDGPSLFSGATEPSHDSLQEALRRNYHSSLPWPAIASAQSALLSLDSFNFPRLFAWNDLPSSNSDEQHDAIGRMVFGPSSIESDFDWLTKNQHPGNTRGMTSLILWLNKMPEEWRRASAAFRRQLLTVDPSYSVWIDWYERRVRGEEAAFDIPGDKRRIEDKKILRRLAEATDDDFWGKGHEYVNATLKGWLDEARARVATSEEKEDITDIRNFSGVSSGGGSVFANTEKVLPVVPTQNRNAISFRTDEDGRIAIDASASVDQLRTDTEARDRHSEAASEAQAVLDRCRGNNAAARLTLRLENYLAAIGTSIEDTKPSLLVQRGEKLRQELAAYAAPDTLLDPIADDILVDLRGWQSSHNMMVGLDPVLMAIDTAMLGPDRRPALIPPDEIKQFVHDGVEADLLAEGTEDILVEAADLAPAIPDPNDRRTNASIEMVRNLCIETISIVLNDPIKSAVAATVISGIVSPILVGGMATPISLLSSIKAAEYLVAHRQWIEERMGNTPVWQALFIKVADWLEKATPFKPK